MVLQRLVCAKMEIRKHMNGANPQWADADLGRRGRQQKRQSCPQSRQNHYSAPRRKVPWLILSTRWRIKSCLAPYYWIVSCSGKRDREEWQNNEIVMDWYSFSMKLLKSNKRHATKVVAINKTFNCGWFWFCLERIAHASWTAYWKGCPDDSPSLFLSKCLPSMVGATTSMTLHCMHAHTRFYAALFWCHGPYGQDGFVVRAKTSCRRRWYVARKKQKAVGPKWAHDLEKWFFRAILDLDVAKMKQTSSYKGATGTSRETNDVCDVMHGQLWGDDMRRENVKDVSFLSHCICM